ncbi:MAG: 2-oxoacid:ferredoxin oxidoreductase subunit beta [Candidatus Cloacimonetes bacterium]|nr:2-oxoacid:ferredoxin oxidoreductase subunit beta [Candidatus Cloacimonadota bacterium]
MKIHPLFSTFANAVKKAEIESDKICLVSDFLYQPKISEYLGFDLFHVTRGRSIPFATGMKLGNPKLKVVVFVGDLITLGGNHFMHASRRNMDIVVICVNNFLYPKINGKKSPTIKSAFSPYSVFERPVNIPHVARSSRAVYVARWTALHKKELTESMTRALGKSGFSVIEVISPGNCYFAGIPASPKENELIEFYHKNSEIKNDEDTKNVEITAEKKIIVGKFFEKKRPTYIDSYNERHSKVIGDKFKIYE